MNFYPRSAFDLTSKGNRITFFGILATLTLTGLFAVLAPQNFMLDDTFFYFQIANNAAHSMGSTFNGIHETNGYHPLWELCCIALALIANGDKQLLLQLGAILQVMFVGGTLYYIGKTAKILGIASIAYFFPIASIFFITFYVFGSEAAIIGLVFSLILYLSVKNYKSERARDWFIFGLALGALFLARLDNGLVILSLLLLLRIYGLKQFGYRKSIKLFAISALGVLILATPYLIYNYVQFHHCVPISGSIKSTFPHISSKFLTGNKTCGIYMLCSLGLLLWGVIFEKDTTRRRFSIIVGAASMAPNLYVRAFTDNLSHWNWYWTLNVISLMFLSALIIDKLIAVSYRERICKAACFSAFAVFSVYSILFAYSQYLNPVSYNYIPSLTLEAGAKRWQIAAAEWIDTNLPKGTVVATADWPGMLAYYSDARIFALDGLIENFESQDSIVKMGLKSYLKSINAKFFFGPDREANKSFLGYVAKKSKGQTQFEFYSTLYRRSVGRIDFVTGDLAMSIARIQPKSSVPGDKYFDEWALWKLDFSNE